ALALDVPQGVVDGAEGAELHRAGAHAPEAALEEALPDAGNAGRVLPDQVALGHLDQHVHGGDIAVAIGDADLARPVDALVGVDAHDDGALPDVEIDTGVDVPDTQLGDLHLVLSGCPFPVVGGRL